MRYEYPQPPEVFCKKKVFLNISQNSQENTCVECLFNKVAGLKEICEISKNNYFENYLRTAAFAVSKKKGQASRQINQCALPVINTMALWQLMHLGT